MSTRIAINGLGRIGRAILKLALEEPALEVVAVNDLAEVENLAYLLRFDTVYGRYPKPVAAEEGALAIAGRKLRALKPDAARGAGLRRMRFPGTVRATEPCIGPSHPIVDNVRSASVMNGMMDSMMGWMMAPALLGAGLVIGLLAAVVVLLVRLLARR